MPFQFRRDLFRVLPRKCFVPAELVKVMYPVSFGRVLGAFRDDLGRYLPDAPRVLGGGKRFPPPKSCDINVVERDFDALH